MGTSIRGIDLNFDYQFTLLYKKFYFNVKNKILHMCIIANYDKLLSI
jgi:hypothetical protein